MQYILSEEEYTALKAAAQARLKLNTKNLQGLCTKIADTMPIRWTWGDGKENPKPWGCILTKKNEWYCDQCPVQEICPYVSKHYSK
jgi:endonuclease III